MSSIQSMPSSWRAKYQQAQFRTAIFFVEVDTEQSGRRVAMHEYPKRNVPYAEDMGRRAKRYSVSAYLVGHEAWTSNPDFANGLPAVSYLDLKNALIDALDQDGPGVLRLPLPYNMADVTVMVQQYSISESRERGGVATVEMQFVEYGDPAYRPTISTAGNIEQSATALETSMLSTATGLPASQVFNSNSFSLAAPYYQVYSQASPPTTQPTLNQ